MLLVDGPEHHGGEEHGDEAQEAVFFGLGCFGGAVHLNEEQDGCDAADDADKVGEPPDFQDSRGEKHHDRGHKRESDSQNAEDLAARSGVQHGAAHGTDGVFAHDGVLNEADGHAECSHAKTPVESSLAPHPAGDQWTEERADVDAHVEDGVAAVETRIAFLVESAEDGGGGGFHAAGAESHQHQTDRQSKDAGEQAQGDVAEHDDDG